METYHVPVMLRECLEQLAIAPGKIILDCTLGGGGHFSEISRLLGPTGIAVATDRDSDAIVRAQGYCGTLPSKTVIGQHPFSHFPELLQKNNIAGVDGILMDLGVSSHQFDAGVRGFSYRSDAPLDMRMDQRHGETAADLINEASSEMLFKILRDFGEVRNPQRMVDVILRYRARGVVVTTNDFIALLNEEYGELQNSVLSKIFQAFRIAVNHELDELEEALKASIEWLNPGGRLVIMSYHSLEDRIVKNFYRDASVGCICPPALPRCVCHQIPTLKVVTRKPIVPSDGEIERNRRARSAKLRVAQKL